MRGHVSAACMIAATVLAAALARADDTAKRATAEFRLLELGGRKVRWAIPAAGLPAKVSYAFLTKPAQFAGARNCDAMLPPEAALQPSNIETSDFRREVRDAFSTWEQAANVVFVETTSVADAGIVIGADAKARGRAFTNVALREETQGASASGLGAIQQSLICLNPRRPWKIGFDGNLDVYDLRFTLTHEIGHAIGLDHPSPEGQLMSFRYVEKARGLQSGDKAGVETLYGRRGASSAQNGWSARDNETADAAGSSVARPSKADVSAQFSVQDRAFGLGGRDR